MFKGRLGHSLSNFQGLRSHDSLFTNAHNQRGHVTATIRSSCQWSSAFQERNVPLRGDGHDGRRWVKLKSASSSTKYVFVFFRLKKICFDFIWRIFLISKKPAKVMTGEKTRERWSKKNEGDQI